MSEQTKKDMLSPDPGPSRDKKKYDSEWKKRNRHRTRHYARKTYYKQRESWPLWRLAYGSAKRGAKERGLVFDLTSEYVESIFPTHCPVFHVSWERGARHKFRPTIDRIDSSKGYTPGNVQFISHLANTMKSQATQEELKEFAQWVLDLGSQR